MFSPIGGTRKLKYPLYNQETNGNITDDAGLPLNEFVWPSDPEERAILPLYVSQREFTAILSSMDVGADIAYPEQYISVMWIMVRNLRYGVNICDMIASCIANDENVQATLRAFIQNDVSMREWVEDVVQQGAPVSPEKNTGLIVQTEDLDALFGAVTYLVDTMNGANEDLYQAIEASSNNREGGQILFESIPIFETLPLDEISEYVDFMVSSVAENYASAYTTTPITGLRDRIRCALFCLARNNGNSLSWEQIAEYFWGEVNFTVGNYYEVISDFVEFVTTGSWSGEEIATISFANIASVLSGAQEFAGMTFPNLTAIMQLGLNDPDPDWMMLCEECDDPPPPDPECLDLTAEKHGFVEQGGTTWSSGQGFIAVYYAFYLESLLRVFYEGSAFPDPVEKVVVTFSVPTTNVLLYQQGGGQSNLYTGTAVTEIEFSAETIVGWTNYNLAFGLAVSVTTSGDVSGSQFLQEICIYQTV